jgi:hypothetical protein
MLLQPRCNYSPVETTQTDKGQYDLLSFCIAMLRLVSAVYYTVPEEHHSGDPERIEHINNFAQLRYTEENCAMHMRMYLRRRQELLHLHDMSLGRASNRLRNKYVVQNLQTSPMGANCSKRRSQDTTEP